jgi:hypothetical protein
MPPHDDALRPTDSDWPVLLEKVSPRLFHLIRLDKVELVALVDAEAAALTAFESDYDDARVASTQPRPTGVREPFAPRTAGVYMPGGNWAKPGLAPALRGLPPNEPVFSVFIVSDASRDELERLGARLRTYIDGVWTAYVPYRNLRETAADPLVTYTQLAGPLWPDLTEAIVEAGIATHHTTLGHRGSGSLIGVADDAIDFHHADFRSKDGTGSPTTSRILYFWDQDPDAGVIGAPPSVPGASTTFTIGIEYAKSDLDADFAAVPAAGPYTVVKHVADEAHYHGTAVLGCAAGNGNAAAKLRVADRGKAGSGAAPDAGLLFVAMAGITGSFHVVDEGHACDALSYIFARADTLSGKPCAANLSYSSDLGPHDGTSTWDRAFNALLAQKGRAITLSAGNSQVALPHKSATISAGATLDLALDYVPGAGVVLVSDAIEIWFDGQDSISVEVLFTPNHVTTSESSVVGVVTPGGVGSSPSAAPLAMLAGTTVEVQSQTHPHNGDRFISILLNAPAGGPLVTGRWVFRLHGGAIVHGQVDAWVERNNRTCYQWVGTRNPSATVANPGSAALPISVGFYLKKLRNVIEPHSAHGKTRDGRYKPDLCAVGGLFTVPRAYDRRGGPGQEYRVSEAGTSLAAPIVAGTCAILFECRGPDLTSGQVQQILIDHTDRGGITVPSEAWGWGRLDASKICSGPLAKVDVWLMKDAADDGTEPFAREIFWESPDIQLFDETGAQVANPTHDSSKHHSNLVKVTVRNHSAATQKAYNTEVHLYWADPSTYLPFPSAWNASGIFTGAGFTNANNVIAVPDLAPGASHTVTFAWAPPAPGSNLHGNDHFCLLARVENPGDRAVLGSLGSTIVKGSNNLAQRNVHVQSAAMIAASPRPSAGGSPPTPGPANIAEMPFYVARSGGYFARNPTISLNLTVSNVVGDVQLVLPVNVLCWHERSALFDASTGTLRERSRWAEYFGTRTIDLFGADVERVTDIRGARSLRVRSGVATITRDPAAGRLTIPRLHLFTPRIVARVRAIDPVVGLRVGYVRVGQSSLGFGVGGVTLELRSPAT